MIDTHSHLFVEDFKDDLSQVINRAREAGVTKIFMPNIDDGSIDDLLSTCERYSDFCFPLMGLHPTSVGSDYKEKLKIIESEYRKNHDIYVGIGEVGLDYYWDTSYRKEQIKAFKIQIEWALENNLPLIIHCRNAFDDLYDVLLPYKNSALRGIIHSFTGENEDAKKMLTFENFLFGINGVVTFKKSTLPDVLPLIPLDRIVLETDSPYLSPVPYRGKRNETSYIVKVAEKVSDIYGVKIEDVVSKTDKNAFKLFENCK